MPEHDIAPATEASPSPVASNAPVHDALSNALLCEVSWEVCQQLGGIYTVVRTKVPSMIKAWGHRYCLVGPYNPQTSPVEFEEAPPTGPFGAAAKELKGEGVEVHYGHWLVTGHPRVVLLDPRSAFPRLGEIKYGLWESHGISLLDNEPLTDEVVAFGHLVDRFLRRLCDNQAGRHRILAHVHEWMAATAIPALRRGRVPVATVFTTHATQLGRFMAMDDARYYDHVPGSDWRAGAKRYRIEPQVMLERAAANEAHVFTTVSEITAFECEHLLGRRPDILLPNGLNIERFAALHEFQNLHRMYKEKIHDFVMGCFFPHYTFDLDETIYFFTSGRYEYTNKGFDLTLEALARLNWRMKQARLKRTVVFFLITRAAYRSINSELLRSRAVMEELRHTCEAIQEQVGRRLFVQAAAGNWPRLDELVDEYWRLRMRRTLHAWRTQGPPPLVTHDLSFEAEDAVMRQLRNCQLLNRPEDPVKIVYHPEFIVSSDPLFGMDYDQFVRGCHLGIFPSLYEPWGYAPMECVVQGIPAVASDTSGFGAYAAGSIPEHEDHGILVLRRRHVSFDAAAEQLTRYLFQFAHLKRRERIALRNQTESSSEQMDWQNLGRHYRDAHELAVRRCDQQTGQG